MKSKSNRSQFMPVPEPAAGHPFLPPGCEFQFVFSKYSIYPARYGLEMRQPVKLIYFQRARPDQFAPVQARPKFALDPVPFTNN
jgi:hypothetical protein